MSGAPDDAAENQDPGTRRWTSRPARSFASHQCRHSQDAKALPGREVPSKGHGDSSIGETARMNQPMVKPGRRWERALVTGASSGIGWETCLLLASEGTELVVVARDRGRLERLASLVDVPCEVLVADLGDVAQLATVEARLCEDPAVDLLVNNAGFGFSGHFHQMDIDRETEVIAVNITAVTRLSHAAAAAMVGRTGKRSILNVSSLAGFIPAASSATYGATKAFLTSFSQAMHEELKSEGIDVTALCPGFTRTEFQQRANAMTEAGMIPHRLWQSAVDVARAGLDGVAVNKAIVVPGLHNKAAAGLASALPKGALRRIIGAGAKARSSSLTPD